MAADPLWTPSPDRIARANLTSFVRRVEERFDVEIPDYAALHWFSVDRAEDFWNLMWDVGRIDGVKGERVVVFLGARGPSGDRAREAGGGPPAG